MKLKAKTNVELTVLTGILLAPPRNLWESSSSRVRKLNYTSFFRNDESMENFNSHQELHL